MVFKRSVQRYGRTPLPETPYQRAGQLWDERIGSARVQARNWRLMAFGCLALTAGTSATLAWQSMQSRVTPYVVEVDKLGEARAVQPADVEYRPTDPQVAWHLSRFITNIRSLSLDPVLMRRGWLEAYDFATQRGAQFLGEYARSAAPFAQVGDRTVAKPAADALSGLPASYGDASRLGPPLPGDLGRPILRAHERAEATAAPAVDTVAAARQQRMADLKAARESSLMAQVTTGRSVVTPASSAGPEVPEATPATATGTRKEQFAGARDTGGDLNTGALVTPASPNSLLAGSVIAASLITGLNSDLPGMVTAQVTQNVFDTVTGAILLVPQGARLIGKYDSVVAFGQRRALVIWQRLILPDGSSLRLDNMPATDPAGYAGLADRVDFHTWTLLKGVAIATMLGVGSELSISGGSDLVQAIRQSAQTNTARAGDQITQRNLDVQPTVTIRPGAPVRVLVTRDLILAPYPRRTS